MKGKRKQEKGITLIALVITIIVLLILAGVTLSIVMNTGIVDNSKKAVNTYNAQQAKDKLAMAIYNYRIAQYMNSDKSLEDLIAEVGGDAVYNEDTKEYEVYVDGYDFTVSKDLEIASEEITGGDPKTQYEVTISKSEGIESTNTGRKVTDGKSMTIKAEVKDGYVFEKWQITNGKGEIKEETSITTTITPSENVTVEALATAGKMNNIGGNTNIYTFTGEEKAYNNPVIPVGFVAVQTEDAKWKSTDGKTVDDWNKGLVIADAENDGNEFVWVPVDGTIVEYKRSYAERVANVDMNEQGGLDGFTDKLPSDITDDKAQINTYHGFYIARYEAGIPKEKESIIEPENKTAAGIKLARNINGIAPVSKKNQVPWNYINLENSITNAELMESSDYVQSGLLTGKMWDTTLIWLEKSNAVTSEEMNSGVKWGNIANAPVTNITEYSPYGNYGVTWTKTEPRTKVTNGENNQDYKWLLKTGHSNYTKRNNIYDLAGNLWEITAETTQNGYDVVRGGSYSEVTSAPGRFGNADCFHHIGFRVGLYIKEK